MDFVFSLHRTYPSTTDVTKIATSGTDESAESEPKHEQEFRPKIAGAFVMCPLVNGEHCRLEYTRRVYIISLVCPSASRTGIAPEHSGRRHC
jgi:hypothetical protein